ncbi:MAG: dUTP diphosphatase [Gemmatimonadota bacterium]|nr:MAG: dUTP diphosphatase [Gemmatimonadota bacterium]
MDEGIPKIVFHALSDDVTVPARETEGSAGYDVRAYLRGRSVRIRRGANGATDEVRTVAGRLQLEPGDTALVPTGFKARVPRGYEAQVRIRSSIAFKRGLILPNAPGTIDADYPDEWLIMLRNDSRRSAAIEHGERIAQVILNRFAVLEWEPGEVGVSTDRRGGFGSTGES